VNVPPVILNDLCPADGYNILPTAEDLNLFSRTYRLRDETIVVESVENRLEQRKLRQLYQEPELLYEEELWYWIAR
jgi:hypothetical protein